MGRYINKIVLSIDLYKIIFMLSRIAVTKLSLDISYLIISVNNGLEYSIAY